MNNQIFAKISQHKLRYAAQSLAFALGLCAGVPGNASPLDDLRQQVESGKFEMAYRTAQSNPDQIGNPHFDFIYGLAAIGAGHIAEGLLALERHLSVIPANDRARLELARGYFLTGEYGRAQLEFEYVLKHDPPRDVQDNIRRYLDYMRVREGATLRSAKSLYLEFGTGHDSNLNAGTYNNTVQLITGMVPLSSPSAQAAADTYRFAAAGGQWTKRVSNRLAVFAGADVDLHDNVKAKVYNLNNYSGYIGFSYLSGSAMYRLSVSDSEMAVNGDNYRNMVSATAEAQLSIANAASMTAFAQYADASFTADNRVRDSHLTTMGASLNRMFEGVPWNPTLGLRLSATQESNLRLRDDLGRWIFSGQLSASVSPMAGLGLSAELSVQRQKYGADDLAFGSTRRDHQWGANFGASYAIDKDWLLRMELQYADNHSTQNLYDYRRRAWLLKTRYQF